VVAVKVRRPDVVEICTFDLAVMRLVARVLMRIPSLAAISPASAIEQFGRAIHAQLDFRIEARNNRRFRENFRDDPEVVFPEVFPEYSSERILCMSHIDGRKVLETPRGSSEGKRIARIGLRALLKMIFEDGFVHADLHPGNIFVLDSQQVAMVDVGLVGKLDGPHRANFLRFFTAWAKQDADTMAKLLYSLAVDSSPAGEDFASFRASLATLLERTSVHRMAEVHPGKVLFDMLGLLRRHRVRMAPSFTVVNIAIAVTEGIGRQLDPELDLMAEAIPFFMSHPALFQAG
jgi:ubiquinone biosynthesis protein